jgi:nucleoside-diphosphate-sugar epimerase
VSKTVQEQWALLVGRAAPMHVTCVRPFNLLGPGQPADLVPATFLHQIARAVDGEIEEVLVGNTDTARDFIDVRDMAAATWALMKSDKVSPGAVFNLCSGEPVTIEEMLRACLELAGRPVPVRCDATRLKAFDVPKIVGNPAKLRSVTDWRPRISWKQSLEDMWHALRHEH